MVEKARLKKYEYCTKSRMTSAKIVTLCALHGMRLSLLNWKVLSEIITHLSVYDHSLQAPRLWTVMHDKVTATLGAGINVVRYKHSCFYKHFFWGSLQAYNQDQPD